MFWIHHSETAIRQYLLGVDWAYWLASNRSSLLISIQDKVFFPDLPTCVSALSLVGELRMTLQFVNASHSPLNFAMLRPTLATLLSTSPTCSESWSSLSTDTPTRCLKAQILDKSGAVISKESYKWSVSRANAKFDLTSSTISLNLTNVLSRKEYNALRPKSCTLLFRSTFSTSLTFLNFFSRARIPLHSFRCSFEHFP